jgi:anti-sigma factor RsiW
VNCVQTRNLLHAYLDGELDLVRHLETEHHLAECKACSEEHDRLRALSTALKSDRLYFRAPPDLPNRVLASLSRTPAPDPAPSREPIPWRFGLLTALAASVLLVLGGLAFLAWSLYRSGAPIEDRLAREVVASHIRSLQAEHLTDIPSADGHVVKPWFKGKVDYAPTVCELSEDTFPLAGGRLDYLDDRPVAALVYRRRQHVINLFLWPAARVSDAGPTSATRNGYHIVHWMSGGMSWWAVSDLNREELREFVEMVRKEARPASP